MADRPQHSLTLLAPAAAFRKERQNIAEWESHAGGPVVFGGGADKNRRLARSDALCDAPKDQVVDRQVARRLEGGIDEEHQVRKTRRDLGGAGGRGLDKRLRERGIDDHAAKAVPDNDQERRAASILAAIAIVPEAAEQLAHRAHG